MVRKVNACPFSLTVAKINVLTSSLSLVGLLLLIGPIFRLFHEMYLGLHISKTYFVIAVSTHISKHIKQQVTQAKNGCKGL